MKISNITNGEKSSNGNISDTIIAYFL